MTRFLTALAAVALLAACDSATTDTPATGDATTDTEAAAATVAASLALDAGGVLDEAATAARLGMPGAGGLLGPGAGRPGCDATREMDPDTFVWTLTLDCERGRPNGPVSATFQRTSTVRFTAGGTPQAGPEGADALDYAILSGASLFRTPRGSHRVTGLTADFDVTDLDEELVTVNGTYARAGADSLGLPRGGRHVSVYTLDLTATDLRGPRARHAGWGEIVSGTLSGVYRATITHVRPGGTPVTREVERTFTITFPASGMAEVAMAGRRFRFEMGAGGMMP